MSETGKAWGEWSDWHRDSNGIMPCDETGRHYDDVDIQVIQDGDGNTIASRSRGSFKPPPVVGEVVLGGWMNSATDCYFDCEDNNELVKDICLTLPTIDGELLTGEFVGPDGHVIKVEDQGE